MIERHTGRFGSCYYTVKPAVYEFVPAGKPGTEKKLKTVLINLDFVRQPSEPRNKRNDS